MTPHNTLALPILRISMFLFMMVWALEKFVRPEAYQAIFSAFYKQEFGVTTVYIIGAVQVVFLLLFVLGVLRTISYGSVLAMNLVTFLVTLPQIVMPYSGKTNHLFAAAIVVLGASITLFLLRHEDNRWVLHSGDSKDSTDDEGLGASAP